MRIEVRRKTESTKCILGELWIDEQREAYTLEPARTNPVHPGHPCIPAGEYELILSFSPHFKRITPEIINVPSRTAIRVHIGSFPRDTLGCTLIGEMKGADAVYASKIAFDKLMLLLRHTVDKVTIKYVDPEV